MSRGTGAVEERGNTHILGEHYGLNEQEGARRHLRSIMRFSYRRGFSLAPYDGITSDAGWGCMIRAAQSLLARAYTVHHLGRNWRITDNSTLENLRLIRSNSTYCDITRLFLDFVGVNHIYSIQNICAVGMRYNKLPGNWYGAHSIALVLRDLASMHFDNYHGPLQVLVTSGDVIYMDAADDLCLQDPFSTATLSNHTANMYDPLLHPPPNENIPEWKSALVLLLPLRLGMKSIGKDYIAELAEVLKTNESIGFLGGTPNHALYTVGIQEGGHCFVCIDPHTVESHPSLDDSFPSLALYNSLHQERSKIVDGTSFDPSVTLGFYFRTRSCFREWCDRQRSSMKKGGIFSVQLFSTNQSDFIQHIDGEDDGSDDDYVMV